MSQRELIEQPKPHLIAHRGGNLAEENTEEAFKKAISIGFNFLETDVILTSDKKVISYHGAQNSYMRKKSGLEKRKSLQKMSYDEINKLVHGGGQKVPTLESLLKAFPEAFFSVDVKTAEVVKPLADIINESNFANRVSVTSFSLNRSRRLASLISGGAARSTGLCLYRFQAYPAMFFAPITFRFLKRKGIKIVHIPYKCVNSRLLKAAHNKNILVYAWSVNEKDEINRLISIGVDGIISDNIKLLKKLTS